MEKTLEDILIDNNNKLVADKIRKTLLNIRNVPGISAKRWIWELIQNAKDVDNKFNKVEIKIELNQKSMIFSHNGSYFTIENVLGILQQVSTKDSKNLKGQTGKFGTGFIGTHLLSSKVNIRGIVKYKDVFRKFKIFLDRTADSSEKLSKEVQDSITKFRNNMNNKNSEYEYLNVYFQKQTDFDTSYEYLFDEHNPKSLEIAKEGINDLKNTAPITLSTQFKNIASITIIDNINNKITKYSNNYMNLENPQENIEIGLNTIIININDKNSTNENNEKKYFYSYSTKECRLLYQVQKNDKDLFIAVERNNCQPILYRDFPLIGSENFHFPFFLDGFQFNPLETRNGLYLNGDLNIEAIENRNIIEHAINYSIEFIDWLLNQNIDKRYLLAKSIIPEPPQKYDDIAINWFIEQQKKWRKKLKEFRLLKNKIGHYNKLNCLKLPVFKNTFNKNFYKLIEELNITDGKLPIIEDAENWFNIMLTDPLKDVYKIEEDTWDFNYEFSEENLLKKINDLGSITNLASKMYVETNKIIEWLNKLYKFLKDNFCMNFFNEYNLIPNKYGVFKKIQDIYSNEKTKSIPEIFNHIYQKLFKKDLNEILIHYDIDYDIFKEHIQKKNFVDILNEFSNVFKEKNNEENKEYLCNELISLSTKNPIVKQMFEFRQRTDDKFRNIPIKDSNDYFKNYDNHIIWEDLKNFWFTYYTSIIQSQNNIDGLRNLLKYDNNDNGKNNSLIWLNDYIKFMKENSLKIEQYKIFPNQMGNFEFIKDLYYEDSIPEILINIYNKFNIYDIRNSFLSKQITSYKNLSKYTKEYIIAQIEKFFKSSDDTKLKTEISENLLSILPIDNNDITNAVNQFIPYYNIIFNKNIILKKPETKIEMNYGIFLKYILIETYKYIEKMSEKDIKNKKITIARTIKFGWEYLDNNNLNLSVDPSIYKIFLNGNNKFAKMENLKFSLNFNLNDENIKNLFETAKLSPIEYDFNKDLLTTTFIDILKEYKHRFIHLILINITK